MSDTYAEHVGDAIKRLLGLYKLTQAQLGEELHISAQTLVSIVHGRHEARGSTYRAIFGFFGLHRVVDDFEVTLPEIMASFPEVERRAAVLRGEREDV